MQNHHITWFLLELTTLLGGLLLGAYLGYLIYCLFCAILKI